MAIQNDHLAQRMKQLIDRLREANEEYSELAFAQPAAQQLEGPANEEAQRALEAHWGCSLPESYRLFLSCCGGWHNFDLGGMDLLAPSDVGREEVARRIEDFKAWERAEGNSAVGHYLFVGAGGDSSDVVYLDPATRRGEHGEMDVVHSSHDDGEIDRFADFFSFLEDRLELVRELAADERDT
jgi:hypothetical protein